MEQKNFFSLINEGEYSVNELTGGVYQTLSKISDSKKKEFLRRLDEAVAKKPEPTYRVLAMEIYLITLNYLPVSFAEKRLEKLLEVISLHETMASYFIIQARDLVVKIINTWSVQKISKSKKVIIQCKSAIPHHLLEPLVNLLFLKDLKKVSLKTLVSEKSFILSCCVSENEYVKASALRLMEKIPQVIPSSYKIQEVENIFLICLKNKQ